MNVLEGKMRSSTNYVEALTAYWDNLGKPIKPPMLDRRPVDLYALRTELAKRGGFQIVTDTKQWADIGRALGYSRETCTSMSFTLKNIFTKLLEPFEMYLECTKEDVQRDARGAKAPAYKSLGTKSTTKPPPKGPGEEVRTFFPFFSFIFLSFLFTSHARCCRSASCAAAAKSPKRCCSATTATAATTCSASSPPSLPSQRATGTARTASCAQVRIFFFFPAFVSSDPI